MKTEWIAVIEDFYDIRIVNSMIGPQQFIAKTFILTNNANLKFFCKVISHPLLISNVINTLPVVAEMVKNGINFIPCPIHGKEGYHFLLEDKLFVLYNYIDVHQGFDYNPAALGSKIAMIHAVSKNVETKPPIETFDFPNETLFMGRFEENLLTQSSDPVIQALKALLQDHETQNRHYINELKKYGSRCKEEQPELVITHGDIATNILVKSENELYIVDWDEMRYAPRERDLWMREELKGFMEGYRAACPDFQLNHDCRCFCILQYYFERMNLHFSDILNESLSYNFRLARVKKLAEGKMAGWNLPKVESTSGAKTNREKNA